MLAEPVKFKVAMLNQKERLEFPDLAPPPVQRPASPPAMQRAEPMPPRAGSDRVSEVHPEARRAAPPAAHAASRAGRTGWASRPAGQPPSRAWPACVTRASSRAEEYEAKKRELLERM